MNPDNLKYHKEHSWVKVDGNRVTIGITDYAQESLGDIVYMGGNFTQAVRADGGATSPRSDLMAVNVVTGSGKTVGDRIASSPRPPGIVRCAATPPSAAAFEVPSTDGSASGLRK